MKSLDTALAVGAGTGNDLAILLKLGAKYIDPVEIDPVIAGIGKMGHPQEPYADPRVHLHVNDARAYRACSHVRGPAASGCITVTSWSITRTG